MNENALLLLVVGLVSCFRLYRVVRIQWNLPSRHGAGFFLNVEVPQGFYDGPGARWIARYRGVVLAEYAVELFTMVAILVSGHWRYVPMWAGGCAVLHMATMLPVQAYICRRLANPLPQQTRVAASLRPRRLGDYLSWRTEVALGALIALSWYWLGARSDEGVFRLGPVMLTYAVLSMIPLKILLIRNRHPLPAERTKDHHEWTEASRASSLRIISIAQWFVAVILAGYAILNSLAPADRSGWLFWGIVALALGVWLRMMLVIIRDFQRLSAMGRDLRPVGSWRGPFGTATQAMPAAGILWTTGYLIGLALLFLLFRS